MRIFRILNLSDNFSVSVSITTKLDSIFPNLHECLIIHIIAWAWNLSHFWFLISPHSPHSINQKILLIQPPRCVWVPPGSAHLHCGHPGPGPQLPTWHLQCFRIPLLLHAPLHSTTHHSERGLIKTYTAGNSPAWKPQGASAALRISFRVLTVAMRLCVKWQPFPRALTALQPLIYHSSATLTPGWLQDDAEVIVFTILTLGITSHPQISA